MQLSGQLDTVGIGLEHLRVRSLTPIHLEPQHLPMRKDTLQRPPRRETTLLLLSGRASGSPETPLPRDALCHPGVGCGQTGLEAVPSSVLQER